MTSPTAPLPPTFRKSAAPSAGADSRGEKGRRALRAVMDQLAARGHRILRISYRFPKRWDRLGLGECDLITYDPERGELWLVEVKYRDRALDGAPLVSPRQLGRLRLAHAQLRTSGWAEPVLAGLEIRRSRFFLAWVKSLEAPVIEFLENPC